MPQKPVANCFCKAVCLSEGCATSGLGCFIAISRHVFYLSKTAIIFYLVLVCRFTALFCLFNICAVQNCNYVPLTFCRFTPRCFFSVQNHIYFIGFLSFHCTIFCIFSKLQLCSVGFLSFHGTVFLSVQKSVLFKTM